MTAESAASASLPGLPPETGIAQLRWLIDRVAAGDLPVESLIDNFRNLYEDIERVGRPQYHSREEARLIWDVLWVLEFYSPDPGRQSNPAEWNDLDAVRATVRNVARRLQAL